MNFLSQSKHFLSIKCIWKCRLRNGVYLVLASICQPWLIASIWMTRCNQQLWPVSSRSFFSFVCYRVIIGQVNSRISTVFSYCIRHWKTLCQTYSAFSLNSWYIGTQRIWVAMTTADMFCSTCEIYGYGLYIPWFRHTRHVLLWCGLVLVKSANILQDFINREM